MSEKTIEEELNIDGLDLDSKEAAGGKFVYFPRGKGSADLHILSVKQFKGHKAGSSILMKARCLATDVADAEVGREYDLLFSFKDSNTASYSNQSLREIMCAIFGGDPTNPKATKVNPRLLTCIKKGDDFADAGSVVKLVYVAKPATDKVTKQPIIDPETGKQRVYWNAVYQKSDVEAE